MTKHYDDVAQEWTDRMAPQAIADLSDLRAELAGVNGSRRERLLTERDILRAAIRLKDNKHTFLHGGHVSNNYRYRAVATVAAVWRSSDGLWVIIGLASATKGSTGFGHHCDWQPPADRSIAIALPDIVAISGLDCDEPDILADALCDLGLDELAAAIR